MGRWASGGVSVWGGWGGGCEWGECVWGGGVGGVSGVSEWGETHRRPPTHPLTHPSHTLGTHPITRAHRHGSGGAPDSCLRLQLAGGRDAAWAVGLRAGVVGGCVARGGGWVGVACVGCGWLGAAFAARAGSAIHRRTPQPPPNPPHPPSSHLDPLAAVHAPRKVGEAPVQHEVEVAHLVGVGVPRRHHLPHPARVKVARRLQRVAGEDGGGGARGVEALCVWCVGGGVG